MNTAIICEYNPFHNGHKFQIEYIKKNLKTNIICLMSGNLVQRGEFAIFDKYTRAYSVLLNGASLVLELPVQYCISSAENFCFNSVRILHELNIIDNLCFGCEDDDIDALFKISLLLNDDMYKNKIKEKMKSNNSYAKCVSQVIKEHLGDYHFNIIQKPNNILAIEYIKAIIKLNSKIKPIPIKRHLVNHNEKSFGDIASASYIRNLINESKDFLDFCPKNIHKEYKEKIKNKYIPDYNKLNFIILSYLKRLDKIQIRNILKIKNGFENKLFFYIQKYNDLSSLINNLVDKQHSKSNIRRTLLKLYFEINEFEYDFVKILAINNKDSKHIFSNLKISDSKIILSHALNNCIDKNYLKKLIEINNIYNFSLYNHNDNNKNEFLKKIIKI